MVSLWYSMDIHISKGDLRFLKQLKGVNKRSNGYKIIFKNYKHVRLIQNNITIKMSRVIRQQLQHGFHNERIFYLSYGKDQRRTVSTCWYLSYATVVIHNYRKYKMPQMVQTK